MDKKQYLKNKSNNLNNIILFVMFINIIMILVRYFVGYRTIVIVDIIFTSIIVILAIITKFFRSSDQLLSVVFKLNLIGLLASIVLPAFEQLGTAKTVIATIAYLISLGIFLLLHYVWDKLYNKNEHKFNRKD